jgi:hypothetical protein
VSQPPPDLAEFLLARIAEDEALVPGDDPDSWAGEPALEWGHDGLIVNPHRILAECEAKRQIVILHGPMSVVPGNEWFNDAHLTSEPMRLCRSCEPEKMFRREKSYPCRTILALAQPYSDHPDFDPRWRS